MHSNLSLKLWCRRDSKLFAAEITIEAPKQVGPEKWQCDWSLGSLLNHQGLPISQANSMFAMLSTIKFIATFLKGREDMGDQFYLSSTDTKPVPIAQLFSELNLT